MKTIVKGLPDPSLAQALKDGLTWEEFHHDRHDDYLAVRNQGLNEQGEECAYTGLWLGEGTSYKLHIDHYRKKSIYPGLRFDWNNLFVAAKDLSYGADYKDKRISGTQATTDQIYESILSPLNPNLNEKFWCQQNGNLIPRQNLSPEEKAVVKKTIDIFNLNDEKLKAKRQDVIRMVGQCKDLSSEEIREWFKNLGFSFVITQELNVRVKLKSV